MKNIKYFLYLSPIALLLTSCAGGNNPGIEYAPDMYDSKAYEPYNQIDSNTINDLGLNMRKPVSGSVAIGKADYIYSLPNNGEGYERAASEVIMPAGLLDELCEGKRLYGIYCTPCHGSEGKNDGKVFKKAAYLVPGAWADGYQNEYIKNLPVGQIYHTLVYGKNNMGSHSSVLTPTERWQVIEYVKQLSKGIVDCDNKAIKTENSATSNAINLNDTVLFDKYEVVEIDKKLQSIIEKNLFILQFETGSAKIKESSFAALNDMALALQENKNLKIVIDGPTDNVGEQVANTILSKQRAEAVKAFLVQKGFDKNRLFTNGYGSKKPIDSSATETAKAKNRRVKFTFIK